MEEDLKLWRSWWIVLC